MALTLHYLEVVKLDVREAKDWYKRQSPGLDKEFAKEVKKCIQRLQKNPLGYEVKYRNVRTAFTEIFPYDCCVCFNQGNFIPNRGYDTPIWGIISPWLLK